MPSRHKHTIPVHTLEELSPLGLEVRAVSMTTDKPGENLGAHRDDHYIFILLETGESRIMVDFQVQCLKAPALLYVQPGQVHEYIGSINAGGWFMAADAMWIGELFQPVLHESATLGPLSITPEQLASLTGLLKVLECSRKDTGMPYFKPILHSLVSAFAGMVAGLYAGQTGACKQALRGSAITVSFRQLLSAQYKTLKSPADYASKLNLSLSYLNETVKANTGFPVSYWIQQETMLEARRLLYYSKISIKEIAYQLGYEDPTYFSRLFKKVVGLSPGEYRKQNRE
ncbi:MAG TPA: AraC family transcriptional regulator [Chitinophaga sp.]